MRLKTSLATGHDTDGSRRHGSLRMSVRPPTIGRGRLSPVPAWRMCATKVRDALVALQAVRNPEPADHIIHSERDASMSPGAVQVWFHLLYQDLGCWPAPTGFKLSVN
jgi:hypothetical protein